MIPLAPVPDSRAGRRALTAWVRDHSILGALSVLHQELGDIFRLPLPGFEAVMVAGAQANRFVLVDERAQLSWRMANDPVGRLLRNGLLMQDGAAHDHLRGVMSPALHRDRVALQVATMARYTGDMTAAWDDAPRDMLVEMRRLALFILMDTLFGVDVRGHLDRVWDPLLKALAYISPGAWLVWRDMPRPGYRAALALLDEYLYALIAARRNGAPSRGDLLDDLIAALGADDDLIRDQLLTMLIAGHDTSTALLAWTLYLFGAHPAAQARARTEADAAFADAPPSEDRLPQLAYLSSVVKESLRLYPPIHLGNRRATADLEFGGCAIPGDTRVLYSTYLSHRDPRVWRAPDRFDPDRFAPEHAPAAPPFAYLPFGGGPRFCIGAAFAQVEAQVVLAQLVRQFEFELVANTVRPHMGATLEPRPRVLMHARRRNEKRPRFFASAESIST